MTDCTIQQTTQAFLEHLKALGKKDRTLYTYGKDLDLVKAFFGAERLLSEVRMPQVGKFYKSPILLVLPDGKPRAPRTVDKTIRVFRMMMVWAKDTGLIADLPLPKSTPMGHSLKTADAPPQ